MANDKKLQNQAGFSLVELLVVLTILALAAAVSLPYARNSDRGQNIENLARRITASLQLTRSQAIARGRNFTATFDRANRRFEFQTDRQVVQIPKSISVVILTAKNEVSPQDAAFRFYPDGTTTGGTITLQTTKRRASISINWLTGNVAQTIKVSE